MCSGTSSRGISTRASGNSGKRSWISAIGAKASRGGADLRYGRTMATAAPAVPSGPAHVSVVSFLAARAEPVGGFWIALAGGVALARTAERRGARLGFGASIAAMLETIAIIGPARIGIPFTQAVT